MSSALRTRRYAGSNPVRKANHQRVGESGRPYLPWKQGIVCSNHTTLTNVAVASPCACAPVGIGHSYVRGSKPRETAKIDPWRNRNAAVCKTVMSRGSTGRVIQDKQIARLRKETAELFHALVDQLDGQRISTPPYAGSSPVERTEMLTEFFGSVGDRYFSVYTQLSSASTPGFGTGLDCSHITFRGLGS